MREVLRASVVSHMGEFELNLEATRRVRFDLVRNQILLKAKIAGSSDYYNFLLDTGTTPSAVDHSLAEQLHFEIRSESEEGVGKGDDRIIVHETLIPMIEVGGVQAEKLEAVTVDLSGVGARLGIPIAGILGYSFLKEKVIRLHYGKREISFLRDTLGSGSSVLPNSSSFQMKLYGDIPLVEDALRIDGRSARMLIDTGAGAKLILFQKGVRKLGLEDEVISWEPATAAGYGGEGAVRKGVLSKPVELGKAVFDSVSITYEPHPVKIVEGDGLSEFPDGVIGNGLLQQFVVTIDYQKRAMVLAPPETGG